MPLAMNDVPDHDEDHIWLKAHLGRTEERAKQVRKMWWAVLTAAVIGTLGTLFTILSYAFVAFVQRGGV